MTKNIFRVTGKSSPRRERQREKEKQEVRHAATQTILSIPDQRKIQEDEIVTHTRISQSTGSGLLRL